MSIFKTIFEGFLILTLMAIASVMTIGVLYGLVIDTLELGSSNYDFKIKFSTFKEYYYLAPSEYKLKSNGVVRDNQVIGFKGLGIIRYWLFRQVVKRNERQVENNKELKKYLETVQKDINKIRGREND